MKKSFIGAALALSILIPAAAQAQAAEPTVPVPARSAYTPGTDEFTDYAHTYKLSNGQVAKFTQQGNQYYVQLKNSVQALQRDESRGQLGVATKLRPVAPGQFVTDSGAQLQFRANGDEVAIDNFEKLPAARVAAAQVKVQMIARR